MWTKKKKQENPFREKLWSYPTIVSDIRPKTCINADLQDPHCGGTPKNPTDDDNQMHEATAAQFRIKIFAQKHPNSLLSSQQSAQIPKNSNTVTFLPSTLHVSSLPAPSSFKCYVETPKASIGHISHTAYKHITQIGNFHQVVTRRKFFTYHFFFFSCPGQIS